MTKNKIAEIRKNVESAHYHGLIDAVKGRVFMSLIATRKEIQAIYLK